MGLVVKLSTILEDMELAKIIAWENSDFISGVREELMLHGEVRQRSRRCIEPLFAEFVQYRLELAGKCDAKLEEIIADPGQHHEIHCAVKLFYEMYLKENRYQQIRGSLICLPKELRSEIEKSFEILDAWHDHYWIQSDERKSEIDAKAPAIDLELFIVKIILYLEINLEKAADDLEIRESVVNERLALKVQ
ncbi:MAG: hypothetical protein SCK57_07590 [Bacillota bacterium]|nr:hypothetical protein [Bacillota bacterium]MDW7677508.1 hypothetical protein [Bacillota bacterium]